MAVAEKPVSPLTHERQYITVKNPITQQEIGKILVSTIEEVRAAAERGCAAQPAWEALGVKERARILLRWADLLWDDQKNGIGIIRDETGKNEAGGFLEIWALDSLASYYYHNAPKFLRTQKRQSLFPLIQKAKVYHKPRGLVGFITPWNYPMFNALLDLVPALFAGNAVLLKPSEVAPLSAIYAVDLMHQAGVPQDIVQIVTGDGRTGAALIDYVDYIAFTGSTATGRKVAARAAERLIPYSLELGGKDPLIVLNDADVDIAASGVLRGALENAGQVCISTERVYVESGIYDQFVERVRHYANQLTIGAGDGFEVHVGSMTNERELLRVEAHVKDAVNKGAEILYGGKRRPDLGPLFFEPTVLVNVDHSMDVMCEETFGPIVPIMRVANSEEAIRLANDSEYGLSASIFTKNLKRGEEIALQIDSGDVCINRTQMTAGTHSLPWGGQKNSGIGRRGGPEGLLRFVTTQSVIIDNLIGSKPELSLADPFSLKMLLTLRKLRRYVSFI
jgi:acyl-CoA reductase-like NAD-dependent aldehyde dehydrogenase